MRKTYFTLMGTSRNAVGGVRWTVAANVSGKQIVGFAEAECSKSGESLEEIGGVSARPMNDDERWIAALDKLNDDGRTFAAFDDADRDAIDEFLGQAITAGCGEQARELIRQFAD
jgi:hypothetical protein